MKAINRYIIVDKIKTEPKKVAGLIMTDDTDVDNRYIKAKIISCGNLVEGLKDGDTIYLYNVYHVQLFYHSIQYHFLLRLQLSYLLI